MGIPLGPINPNDPAVEVYQTLPPSAPLLARLLGSHFCTTRQNVDVTLCTWHGKEYLVKAAYLGPPCWKCGQIDNGQTGEYPCPVCGLPMVWDDRE